jgi:hypothetical protein
MINNPYNIFFELGHFRHGFFGDWGLVENNLIRLPFSERGFESGKVGTARMVGVAGNVNTGGTVGG